MPLQDPYEVLPGDLLVRGHSGMAHAHVVPLGGLFFAGCDLRADDLILGIFGFIGIKCS